MIWNMIHFNFSGRTILIVMLALALSIPLACGGGGDGEPPAVTVPTVLSTDPDNGATGVRLDIEVRIQFSE